MYQLNPLLEVKYKFSTGSLSAGFENLKKAKEPWSRIRPNIQDQLDREARKKAANAIRKFNGNPELKKREWVRQMRSVDEKIRRINKKHGG